MVQEETSRGRLIALVDADILVYRCAFAVQKKDKEIEPVEHAYHALDTVVDSLRDKFSSFKFYITGKGNWRHDVATIKGYKANRKDLEKPVYYQQLRDYLVGKYEAEVTSGCEADDAIGAAQTPDTCIVSIDKDLLQIPGNHYNWVKHEWRAIDERTGHRNFYTQILVGDRTDNVPGIDGIGPVSAEKILSGLSSERALWQACRYQWHKHYPDGVPTDDGRHIDPGQAAIEVAQLLWVAHPGKARWTPPV